MEKYRAYCFSTNDGVNDAALTFRFEDGEVGDAADNAELEAISEAWGFLTRRLVELAAGRDT